MAKRNRNKMVYLDEDTHRMAKSIAGLQGLSLKKYFGKKVEEDIKAQPMKLHIDLNFNRRGQLFVEVIVVFALLFAFAIALIYVNMAFKGVNQATQANSQWSPGSKEMLNNMANNYGSVWDGLLIFLFGGFWLFFLVSTYYLDAHPIFFVIMLLIMVASFVVMMILSNAYSTIINGETQTALSAQSFPMTNWLISHYLEMGIMIFVTCMMTLYAKPKAGGAGI